MTNEAAIELYRHSSAFVRNRPSAAGSNDEGENQCRINLLQDRNSPKSSIQLSPAAAPRTPAGLFLFR